MGELIEQEAAPTGLVSAPAEDVSELVRHAISSGAPVETMERLLAMRRELRDEAARTAFYEALAKFQSRCPTIEKRKAADRYKYAPLEDIVATVRDLEQECGFAHQFDSEPQEGGGVAVTCKITHAGGHSEVSRVFMPATQGVKTNASQDMGVMITYGRRYSFTDAFGIVTGDTDTDGRVQKPRGDPISESQAADLAALCEEVGADKARFLAYMQVDSFAEISSDQHAKAVQALEAKRGGA